MSALNSSGPHRVPQHVLTQLHLYCSQADATSLHHLLQQGLIQHLLVTAGSCPHSPTCFCEPSLRLLLTVLGRLKDTGGASQLQHLVPKDALPPLLTLLASPCAPASSRAAAAEMLTCLVEGPCLILDHLFKAGVLEVALSAVTCYEPLLQLHACQLLAALTSDSMGWAWDWPSLHLVLLGGRLAALVELMLASGGELERAVLQVGAGRQAAAWATEGGCRAVLGQRGAGQGGAGKLGGMTP